MDVALGTLEHIDPRIVWKTEAGAFTPWLAKNIDRLAEVLGLDLEVTETEGAVGDFACDIVARDLTSSRPVIIENQLEPTDHRHLGQLITYAAGLDAAVVVWISREVREEHRQAIDWLNRHTDEGIEFFAVVVDLVRIGDSVPAVLFRPVASPNAWGKATVEAKSAPSERSAAYQAFFQQVFDELRIKHAFTNAKVAQPQNWYSFKSGNTGFYYNATFAKGGKLRAELYIDTPNKAVNKAAFDYFLGLKGEVESEMGASLDWERLDNARASRISVVLPDTDIDDAAVRSDEMRAWLVGQLLKIKATFGPRIPAALASAKAAVPASVPT